MVLDDDEESTDVLVILPANETRAPDLNLAGFLPDASDDSGEGPSELDTSDDMTVPAAAYAPPEVYRTPTAETVADFSFDTDDEDMSFEYVRPTDSSNSEGMDEDSLYTDVGNEIDMLRSPGQLVDAPIDLTGSGLTLLIHLTRTMGSRISLHLRSLFSPTLVMTNRRQRRVINSS